MKYIEDRCRACGRNPTFAPSYCELHFAKYDPKQYVRLLAFIKYGQNRCRQCQDCKRVGDVGKAVRGTQLVIYSMIR